jgi:hypothetical protein
MSFIAPYTQYSVYNRLRRENFKIDPSKPIRSIPLPIGWFAYQAWNGRVFYYNADTKKSQWIPPEGAGYGGGREPIK